MIQLKNFLSKREQSQACLSFAKREKSRLLAKTLLTLVALFAVTTGAWAAADVTWTFAQVHDVVGDAITDGETYTSDGISLTFVKNDNMHSCEFTASSISITGGGGCLQFTAPEGKKFSKIVLNSSATSSQDQSFCSWNPGYVDGLYSTTWQGDEPAAVVTTSPVGSGWDFNLYKPTTFEFYFAASGSTVALTRGTGDKDNEWTLTDGMPAGNVILEVEYYDQATIDGSLAVVESVTTGDTDPIVDGITAIGGTLMYGISTSNTTAPTSWSDKAPTGADFTTAGTYYVWIYAKGPEEGVDGATATYSDSDYEIVGPFTVAIATYTLALNPASADNITVVVDGQSATLTEGKLEGVKMGSKVTLTAANGYKFRKVEATKGISTLKSVKIGNYTVYYAEGENWYQAFRRDENNNCGLETSVGRVFTYDDKSLRDSGGDVSADAVINPSKGYYIE